MDSKVKAKAIALTTLIVLLVVGTVALFNLKTIEKKLFGHVITVGEEEKKPVETPVPEEEGAILEFVEGGFAGADPAGQIGDDLSGFTEDAMFFDSKVAAYQERLNALRADELDLVINSIQQDLRIQIMNKRGQIVTGVPFVINLKDTGSYTDNDEDGLVYIGGLLPGEYEVSLEKEEGFTMPPSTIVSVKEKVEYVPIADISLLMKTESDIDAEKEDLAVNDADEEADETEVKEVLELGGDGEMGIDVSKYQGDIDWDQVAASGIRFAIIRAGYRGCSTGALVEDPYFFQNIRGALGAGLKVGVYFFTQATNEVEAVEEASMALALTKDYNLALPIFIDSEGAGGNGRADGLDMVTRTAVVKAFCNTIRNEGRSAGVYASKNWFHNNLSVSEIAEHTIWLAEYRQTPTYAGSYQYWQYTSNGSVPGIDGRVDLDISYVYN